MIGKEHKVVTTTKLAVILVAVILSGCAYLLATCIAREEMKILFIGIDGADWEMVGPLAGQGMLPHFDRLMRSGTSVKVHTAGRKGSPVYWTTIATGQWSKRHGILGFVVKNSQGQGEIPYTSNMRKTKAFWNVLSAKGISVGIVGWFVTWPVEEVNGFMISPYCAIDQTRQVTKKGTVYKGMENMVYPPNMRQTVDESIRIAKSKYRENIKAIIKASALKDKRRIVRQTQWAFMTDEMYSEIGVKLYREKKPRVFAVYFNGVDVAGHRFTSTDDAEQQLLDAQFGEVHRNYYIYIDKVVGRLIDLADENTIVIITADHGLMRKEHTNNGVFIISGPNIRENSWITTRPINLTDICPTLLYLLGVPAARDMDGRVFEEAIAEDYLKYHRIAQVRSYGKRETSNDVPRRSHLDDEIVERLKSLGYLE